MLRAYFMPCDFYPKILMAGDKPDVCQLIDVLDEFIDHPTPIEIQHLSKILLKDFTLTLKPQQQDELEGLFQTSKGHFDWVLSRDTALHFYQEIDEMINQPEQSGSLFLEMLRPDEIKIKISMNEFDDSYLQ